MPQVKSLPPGDSIIRILITTDNHIGYNENDPITGDDAFNTFREILRIAQTKDVDMILQSGDLFHISKPSKKSVYQVTKALRDYCYGEKPCELQLLSDVSGVLDDGVDLLNYEDPNINVSLPVFAISGNHDEASGNGLLSPLDLLSAAGLINHFGKHPQADKVTVSPILLQKGITKLALYGLANIRDERIKRTFEEEKVKFQIPSARQDEFFNLLCVHQNHQAHTNTGYLPEEYLPSFLDLVIWGHEHECVPYAVPNNNAGFDVLQPGSSVATSLCEGEAIEKQVFILSVKENEYSLEPIRLKTVRPFVMQEIKLSHIKSLKPGLVYKGEVNEYLMGKVNELIEEAKTDYVEINKDMFEDLSEEEIEELIPLPLIRLRVDYTGGYEIENPRRFSNRFVGKVANVDSVVQFHLKKTNETNNNKDKKQVSLEFSKENGIDEERESVSIETFITNYLKQSELTLLPELGVSDAVKKMIEREDKTTVKEYVNFELQAQVDAFLDLAKDDDFNFEENFKKVVKGVKEERLKQIMRDSYKTDLEKFASENKQDTSTRKKSTSASASKTSHAGRKKSSKVVESESDEEMEALEADLPKSRGRRPADGSTTTTTKGRTKQTTARKLMSGKTRKQSPKSVEVIESEEDQDMLDLNDEDGDDDEDFNEPSYANQHQDIEEIVSDSEPESVIAADRGTSTRGRGRGRGSSRGGSSTRGGGTGRGRCRGRGRGSQSVTGNQLSATNTIAELLARKKKTK